MARLSGRLQRWGAFLDSTLDRVGDAAIFGGLVLWYAGGGDDIAMAALALACLILGSVVVVRQGPRRGARDDGQRRHRRAGRPAGRRAGRRPGSSASACPRSCSPSCCGCWPLASLVTVVQRMRRPYAGRPLASAAAAPRRLRSEPALRGLAASTRAYFAGWRRRPAAARSAAAYRLFDRIADRVLAPAAAAACGGSRPTCARVAPGRGAGSELRRAVREPACGPTCATGATRSGCRLVAGAADQHGPHRGRRAGARALAAGRGVVMFLRPHGQLGPRRRLVDRRAGAGARPWPSGCEPEALFERVPGLPRGAGHADRAADRRRRRVPRRCSRRLRGRRPSCPAGRPRPDRNTASRSTSSASRARMAAGPAALAVATGRRAVPRVDPLRAGCAPAAGTASSSTSHDGCPCRTAGAAATRSRR